MATHSATFTTPSATSQPRYELPSKEEVAAQWLFSEDDLNYTPTVLSGLLKPADERKARRRGVGLIYKTAERSQLHSHVLHTAALFFQRFFFRSVMRPPGYPVLYAGQRTYVYQDIALAALYLASKVEEAYRKLDDLVAIACEVEPGRVGAGLEEGESEQAALRSSILAGEEILLATLCFDLIVEHPQKQLIIACRRLGVEVELLRCAYANMHDSFRDPICTFFEGPVLAAGVFALACEDADVDPETYSAPNGGDQDQSDRLSWLETFDVSEDEVEACLAALRSVRSSLQISEPRLASSTTGTPRTNPATPYHISAPASSGNLTPLAAPVSATASDPQQPHEPPPALPPAPLERVATTNAAESDSSNKNSRPPTRHGGSSLLDSDSGAGVSAGTAGTFSRIEDEVDGTKEKTQLLPPRTRVDADPIGSTAAVPKTVSGDAASAVEKIAYVPLSPTYEEGALSLGGHGNGKGERSNGKVAPRVAEALGQPTAQPVSQPQGYVPLSPPNFLEEDTPVAKEAVAGDTEMKADDSENRQTDGAFRGQVAGSSGVLNQGGGATTRPGEEEPREKDPLDQVKQQQDEDELEEGEL